MSLRWIWFSLLILAITGGGCAKVVVENGGAGGEGGAGGGGAGGAGGAGGVSGTPAVEKTIRLGCRENGFFSGLTWIFDWELSIAPDALVTGGADFDATLGGTVFVSEGILDTWHEAFLGIRRIALADIAATVLARSGASGDPVILERVELPYTCADGGATCDPTKSETDGTNEECFPASASNPCLAFVSVIPISEDCGVGGVCEALGKESQCEAIGSCVTGPLLVELAPATGTYTADASGEILFGWDDENTGATVNPDGTYNLPPVGFPQPAPPNGVRLLLGVGAADSGNFFTLALQCTMAVDSGDPIYGVGVADRSSPTPDQLLLPIPIVE